MSGTKSDLPGGGSPTANDEEDTGTIPQPEMDAPVTETQAMTSEGTEILDAKEDVLVLLPEGAEGDIPVVDTEEVSEDSVDHTEILKHQSLPIEDVRLKRVNPLSGPEEAPVAEDLEDLASQAEDDFLSAEEPAEEKKPARARRRGIERAPSKSVPDFFPSAKDDFHSAKDDVGSGHEFRWKVPLTLAALLGLAATGYFTYPQWKHLVEGELMSLTGGTATKALVEPGKDPTTKEHLPVGAGKTLGGTKSAGVPEEVARASKEAFREKFLLSVELGYVGEVSNE